MGVQPVSYLAAFTKRPKGRSSLALAVALALAGTGALAQSNITGSIFGQVAPQSGNTVEIKSVDTGLTRSVTVDEQGRYRFSSLPTGRSSRAATASARCRPAATA